MTYFCLGGAASSHGRTSRCTWDTICVCVSVVRVSAALVLSLCKLTCSSHLLFPPFFTHSSICLHSFPSPPPPPPPPHTPHTSSFLHHVSQVPLAAMSSAECCRVCVHSRTRTHARVHSHKPTRAPTQILLH